jgi:RimJ/RimL family protein N-acetyltransferase
VALVAKHNPGSIRVLQKCGFVAAGEESFTAADGQVIHECIFRLEAPKSYASPACSMPELED